MIDQISPVQLARMIDISAVQAFNTVEDVAGLARVAIEQKFVAAHVLPNFVAILRDQLSGSEVLTGAPVGFPSGGSSASMKAREARELIEAGVQEMDLMINVGRLRSGDTGYVLNDIRCVVDAAAPVPVKVILEVHYLSDDEIKRGCELCIQGGAEFVKTATAGRPRGRLWNGLN